MQKLQRFGKDSAKIIKEALQKGSLVCFPTETVYALSCAYDNEEAIDRIYKVKGRNANKPLSLLVPSIEMIHTIAKVNDKAKKLLDAYSPGPITLVLELRGDFPLSSKINANSRTIGMRVPNSPMALEILQEVGAPVIGTSANISGEQSATLAEEILLNLGEKVDLIIDGGKSTIGLSSTVIDLSGEQPKILRIGSIQEEDIFNIIKN